MVNIKLNKNNIIKNIVNNDAPLLKGFLLLPAKHSLKENAVHTNGNVKKAIFE